MVVFGNVTFDKPISVYSELYIRIFRALFFLLCFSGIKLFDMNSQKKRTANFSSDEKAVLTELVLKYQAVIENKRTDATTNIQKLKGWTRLAEEFNSISSHCYRTPSSLKTCWENIKRQSKKDSANQKREVFKTGGGKPTAPSNNGTGSIVGAILGPALEGLSNIYDSDALEIDGKENDPTMSTNVIDIDDASYDICIETPDYIANKIKSDLASSSQEKNPNSEAIFTTAISAPGPSTIEKEITDWQTWTPATLKQPMSEALKIKPGSTPHLTSNWLKRRRPQQENLGDQLIKEKINLVKILAQNSQDEFKYRLLIIQEQLKQEKLKTQKLKEQE